MPKRYWWILATYIICQLSGFLSLTPLFNFIPKDQRVGIWTVTSFLIALIIILILLLPERKLRIPERASMGETVKWTLLGIIFVYGVNIITGIIDHIVFKAPAGSENTEKIMELANMSPYIVLVIVIVGPILEEIIFRKIIFGQLFKLTNFFARPFLKKMSSQKNLGQILKIISFWVAGIISSLLFALAHFDGHIIIYGSIGLVLCFLYMKTKRIIVSMIAHGSMNAFAVIITFSPTIQKMIQDQQHMSIISHFIFGN